MHLTAYETVTATILAALDRGVIPCRKPWSTNHALPINAMSNRAYRGVNVFLLGLSPYQDHRWLTFKQIRVRGGTVKSGEHATMVIF